MDIAALGFEVDSSQARGAAKALADLNSAAITAANGAAKFEKTLRGVDGRFRSTNDYLAENIREVEALARAYNPVMAAQNAYRDEVLRTATAVKAGVITEQQRATILSQTKERLEQATIASQRFGQSQTVASHHVANLSFQLNDIGMMMASGQSPFMLMIQQGPQVAQIFQQLKQSGQSLGGTLAGAFGMILNPTTLVTLAVIGVTAAITKFAMGADAGKSSAERFKDAVEGLSESSDTLRKATTALAGADLEALRQKYGELTESVWGLVRAQGQLAQLESIKQLSELKKELEDLSGGRWFDFGISEAASGVLRLQTELKISRNDAIALYDRLSAIGQAKGPDQVADSLGRAREYALELANGNEKAAQAMIPLVQRLIQAEDAARQASAATGDWAGNMSSVLSYTNAIARTLSSIGQTGIQIAGARAELEALKQGKSLRESGFIAAKKTLDVEGKQRTAELVKQHGIIGVTMATAEIGQKAILLGVQQELEVQRDISREAERNAKKKPDKSAARKAAAELKSAQKGFQSLRELLEKDTLFQFAEYEKRQAQLQAALDKRLVTQQQYQEYEAALRVQYFGTEYQQRQLQYDLELQQLKQALEQQLITRQEYDALMRQRQWEQISQLGQIRDAGTAYELNQMATAFGEAASMAGDYNQKFLKAQRIFAASAALISTYQGAAKALELPFPMNIAAAAKVIAAGLGFVSAIKSGGSSSGGRGSSSSASSATTKTEPTRQVLVRLEGDDWLVDMAENIMTQIYDQSRDGRIIVARDRR